MLSDKKPGLTVWNARGLNAPFGAQCFPTPNHSFSDAQSVASQCTFWCSVLSDFEYVFLKIFMYKSQCTFWCSVLSDFERYVSGVPEYQVSMHLLVLSAFRRTSTKQTVTSGKVSMHLLVLSAFRHSISKDTCQASPSLNAPFGAQCFPTGNQWTPIMTPL